MAAGEGPIVGREAELERLRSLLDGLDGGAPACLVVEGEPGIGKTALLAALRREADERGYLVLAGAAEEFERDVSFGVWTDALDAYIAARGEEDLDPMLLSELTSVLPSVPANGDRPDPVLAEERYRTHRAMRGLLELIAAEKPLVLVLDDLHWSDTASAELTAALLRRETAAPVLLGLGYRSGNAPPRLAAALGAVSVTIMKLAPLSQEDCASLIGEGVDMARSDVIFSESGGNPFYALQLARAAAQPANDAAGDWLVGATGVPDAVSAALTEELRTLSPTSRVLLEAGAVAGDPFEPELATEVGQLQAEAGFAALDELLDAGLLRPTDVPRRFAFRHPLVRRAVYESAKGGWRLGAHARAAEALASQGASAATRAHHVEQSAAVGDDAAIAALLEAAAATAASAPAGAARWYTAALRLMPASDGETRLQALAGLAQVLRSTGELERCRATLLQGMELLPPDNVVMRVAATSGCAACEDFLGRHEEARERLEAELANVADPDSKEGVNLTLQLAAGGFLTMDLDRMREAAERALPAARDVEDPALTASAVAMLAHVDALTGRIEAAQAGLDEAAALLEGIPDSDLAMRLEAINRLGWAAFYLERYDDAIAYLDRGLAVARASGQGVFIPLMEEAQALSAMMRGDHALAISLRENAIEGARLTASRYVTCTALITSASVMNAMGDQEAALRDAEESVALAQGLDPGFVPSLAAACFAVTALEAGDSGADPDALVAAAGGWGMPILPAVWRVTFQEAHVRAELAAGRVETARTSADLAESAADEVALPVINAIAKRARAAILLADGDGAAAATLALDSAGSAEAAGARIEAARSRTLAGQALAASGERDRAVEALRAAEAELDECGAARARNEARRDLRKLGARAEPRGPGASAESGLDSLSRREREVADLVTARKTNREIATELFLSEKTVETHLRNIFVKLGASSRVEVARAVERDVKESRPL